MPFQVPTPTLQMAWLLLAVAIAFEVAGTVCMRLSDGFRNLLPSVLIFVFYAVAFALNTVVVRTIDLSITYAVWSGVGTVATAIIGFYLFKESATALKLASISLIIVGVIGLHTASRSGA